MASLPFATVTAVVLLFLATTATARPCRTFLISSYSFRDPSSDTYATITEIRYLPPLSIPVDVIINPNFPTITPIDKAFFHSFPRNHHNLQLKPRASLPRAPLGFTPSNYAFSSLRDRTKDILSVVLALLFGVGCGALTAATMYLVWSVFTGRHDYRSFDDFSSSDDDSEIESPKKMGYVKIPAAETAAPAPPAPAKVSV